MIRSETKKLQEFFSKGRLLHYKKNETILRSGETPQGIYFVDRGYIRLYSTSESGEELTLIIFKPNDFFPIMWAINDTPNEYYLEAMTNVELYRSPKDEFSHFLSSNPDVLFEITQKILERFGRILRRMEHLAFGNACQKVASILVICAQHFGQKEREARIIQVPLTHKDIANLIGTTRETVSIEMKKLQRKGIVEHDGKHIRVKDINKLQKESLLVDN